MILKNLKPGDIFGYIDGSPEFLSGTFMRMHECNTYTKPLMKKNCVVIMDLYDGMMHVHSDRREVNVISKSEETMENKMGHFIGWKFGVPVRVSSRSYSLPYTAGKVLLIKETEDTFTVMFESFIKEYNKAAYCYELIPHQAEGRGPAYPVCKNDCNTTYCNARVNGLMSFPVFGGISNNRVKLTPLATLNIDGKTIELSAETTAELKKKLEI